MAATPDPETMILPLLERLESGELSHEAAEEVAAVMRAITLKAGGRDGDLAGWCQCFDGDLILSPRGEGELLRVAYERGRHDERAREGR